MKTANDRGWLQYLGVELSPVSHRERLVSALGGLLGIGLVMAATRLLDASPAEPLLVLSIGASAVLVFSVPHGALSQPWPVIGGHLVSALTGVTCARWLADPLLAAPVAVALAILAMHYLRCIHPPGGATALAAIFGGEAVRAKGYGFVWSPVLFEAVVLVATAVAFNFFFAWRRYPLRLAQRRTRHPADGLPPAIAHEDFVFALSQMDSFIDVSEQDLLRIYDMATRRHRETEAAARALNPSGPRESC